MSRSINYYLPIQFGLTRRHTPRLLNKPTNSGWTRVETWCRKTRVTTILPYISFEVRYSLWFTTKHSQNRLIQDAYWGVRRSLGEGSGCRSLYVTISFTVKTLPGKNLLTPKTILWCINFTRWTKVTIVLLGPHRLRFIEVFSVLEKCLYFTRNKRINSHPSRTIIFTRLSLSKSYL